MKLHLAHRLVGVQPLQALPDHALAVEPERRPGQAGFELHQQVGVLPIGKTLLIGLELVGRQPAQRGDLLGIALRDGIDGQPQHGAVQAQGAHIRGLLLEPPGAQRAGVFLQRPQGLLRFLFVVDRRAGVNSWVAACLTCATTAPTAPGSGWLSAAR